MVISISGSADSAVARGLDLVETVESLEKGPVTSEGKPWVLGGYLTGWFIYGLFMVYLWFIYVIFMVYLWFISDLFMFYYGLFMCVEILDI